MKGSKKVLANLNKEVNQIRGRTIGGLLAGGLIVQADSQRRTPVHFGNLRGSAYTRRAQGNPNGIEIGYSADYAIYVHENVEEKWRGKERKDGIGVYWGPKGESQFLLKAIKAKQKEFIDAVHSHARIR